MLVLLRFLVLDLAESCANFLFLFFVTQYVLTLCARCYVHGNYWVGVSSSDFRRVEISEETKANWTDKETLHLVEAIMHYGDDWRRIAQHVGGRSEKECIAHLLSFLLGRNYSLTKMLVLAMTDVINQRDWLIVNADWKSLAQGSKVKECV
ncbi:hypothetical protein L6164_024969 [Bauhinia variegata]|uniref:Uncharacterized protein n=1 Tax=Bauhinia variegata TaxID=167791 RepID=A0ACB9M0S4_BAUVA|nr:hypothetical protein L6164_024969 [Bauhinia variegata]